MNRLKILVDLKGNSVNNMQMWKIKSGDKVV